MLSSNHPLGPVVPFARRRLAVALLCALGLGSMPAGAAEEDEEDKGALQLEQVTVVDKADSPVGPDTGYTAKRSMAGTKTDTPLNEIPRSVSITTEQQMRDRNVGTISDALHYTAGVQADVFGQDNRGDWFIIRGFKQANNGLYRNGNRVHSSGFFSWQVDPFLLERIEVLKGAASVLYGQNLPLPMRRGWMGIEARGSRCAARGLSPPFRDDCPRLTAPRRSDARCRDAAARASECRGSPPGWRDSSARPGCRWPAGGRRAGRPAGRSSGRPG